MNIDKIANDAVKQVTHTMIHLNGDIFKAACVLALALVSVAICMMFRAYFTSVSKQPDLASSLGSTALIAAAFIEGVALLVFLLCLLKC